MSGEKASTIDFNTGTHIFVLQANPDPNCCLGIFGLSLYTTERDLRDVFSKYGPLADVCIVYDQQSRRSRGFCFVYFENREDAKEVRLLNVWVWVSTRVHDLVGALRNHYVVVARQRNEPTVWSWTGGGSGWTSPSRKDLTPQPRVSTWAAPHSKSDDDCPVFTAAWRAS